MNAIRAKYARNGTVDVTCSFCETAWYTNLYRVHDSAVRHLDLFCEGPVDSGSWSTEQRQREQLPRQLSSDFFVRTDGLMQKGEPSPAPSTRET